MSRAQITSPGKLSRAHQRWETSCESCHGPGGKVEPQRCLRCHSALAQRIAANKGSHARNRSRCERCHSDHRGLSFQMIVWPGGRAAFDHRQTGYPLTGKHSKVRRCEACHQPKFQREPRVTRWPQARRRRTSLGLWNQCYSCHKDIHQGKLGSRCEQCHETSGFVPVRFFSEHDRTRFALRGAHRRVDCRKCHRQRAGAWAFAGLAFGKCSNCHQSPHPQTMTATSKRPLSCRSCHSEQRFSSLRFAAEDHPKTLPLIGGHRRARCRACHGKGAKKVKLPVTCSSCHKDIHKGRFGPQCQRCHSPLSWRKEKRSGLQSAGQLSERQQIDAQQLGVALALVKAVAFHNRARFPLTGRHMVTPCAKCHRPGRPKRPLRFANCEDCHRDPHNGTLTAARSKRRCIDCHDTRSWTLSAYGFAQHKKSGFPLEGAHAAVACAKCHSRKLPAAQRFAKRSARCESCHRDVHRGRFRKTAASRPLPCATCHRSQTFTDSAFAHDKTPFPLRGAHAQTACRSCHRADSNGVTAFAKLKGARCATCHQDVHRGQFARRPKRQGCEQCHSDTSKGFRVDKFDHRRFARFALDGGHQRLECKACHRKRRVDGVQVVVYRHGRRQCASCHVQQHHKVLTRCSSARRPALESALARCDNCHQTLSFRAAKKSISFDHKLVGYELRGGHSKARCENCHNAQHRAQRSCQTCHSDPHRQRLGQRCAECHQPEGWRTVDILARHRKTRLPLTGAHALADCASCHPITRRPRYQGTPSACVACHRSDYTDPKNHPDHLASGFSQQCQDCHLPTGWRPAGFRRGAAALLAHQQFSLAGAHAAQACTACHTNKRASRRCVSCHREAATNVRLPDHRLTGFSRCERCHQSRSWRQVTFIHRAGRGHRPQLGCTDCHGQRGGSQYTCTGRCHDLPKSLRQHRGRPGFVYDSRACQRCHRLGGKL
ncbi:MAG: hypothetical protein H6707_17515 [Deltaproteobacteria bacterium]|nr:hypothetical protein [Deltaproteobacteria bacterium]